MKKLLAKKINIFLTVDLQTINSYFNAHDPSPIYKRQLNHQFEQYIMTTVASAKRHSVFFYKLKCTNDFDKQYAEPLMYAIRRHFSVKKELREADFLRFKRKSFRLFAISLIIATFCQGVLPMFLNSQNHIESLIVTSFDVLSWVILWEPIEKLIFEWNPNLKAISILDKLSVAEMMIVDVRKEIIQQNEPIMFSVSQTG